MLQFLSDDYIGSDDYIMVMRYGSGYCVLALLVVCVYCLLVLLFSGSD